MSPGVGITWERGLPKLLSGMVVVSLLAEKEI